MAKVFSCVHGESIFKEEKNNSEQLDHMLTKVKREGGFSLMPNTRYVEGESFFE